MTHSMSLISIGLGFSQIPKTKVGVCGRFNRRSSARLRIQAVQENGGSRRLVDIIRLVPDLSKNYFRRPSRRTLFGGIALLGGFYVAQTISLSFGALAVNDVIAAVFSHAPITTFERAAGGERAPPPDPAASGDETKRKLPVLQVSPEIAIRGKTNDVDENSGEK